MTDHTLYLLDQLEMADMLLIDGLHAWQFELDEALLDRAEAAADASEPFASEEVVLRVEVVDGRDRRQWQFTYNEVMEAQHQAEDDSWVLLQGEREHRLCCLGAHSASGEDD